jgi:general stress protein 26
MRRVPVAAAPPAAEDGAMDSINRQQPEENRLDLRDDDAVHRIRDVVSKSATCFFCTRISTGDSNGTRPMSVRRVDDDGTVWFLSADDSHKNSELAQDDAVALFFQSSEHSDFLHLGGRASVTRDRGVIESLWEPVLRTWFTAGVDDPRITAIRVEPRHGYYWDNKHGNAVAGLKMLVGAALGKTLDDSIEGRIELGGEPAQRRRVA